VRAALMAALFAGLLLLSRTQLYATMLVMVGVAILLLADIWRLATLAQGPAARASSPLDRERVQQLQYLEALLDTVAAALIVVRADGRVHLVNHAARRLASAPVRDLHDITAFGPTAAEVIRNLAAGTGQVIQLQRGQLMHVSVVQFRRTGLSQDRLISLQRITGDLDAVEVKAWQDVTSVITHEIMNSLTPIASLSANLEDLLRAGGSERSSEIAGALETIKRRSQGLMSFVERYRTVAEIPEPVLSPVRIEAFFAGIRRLMSATFQEQGIAYRERLQRTDITVTADAELLEHAVINLLRNAVDAVVETANPCVEIACELHDSRIRISVADNGRGLSDAQKDLIFVPFFTTKAHGMGIGLSFARHVAIAHGGHIEVQSREPQGTVFSLILPAAAQP
jgi:two-component system, NtrC family, nitrogen regulation sensor histidine kinase NtrY